MYAGAPGRVVFVVDTDSFSAEYPAQQWDYLGQGFMIETKAFGLVHFDQADEDLDLVGRGDV